MPLFIVVTTLTQAGSAAFLEEPDRLENVNREVERLGAKILHQYRTVGVYDFVTFIEAANNETAAQIASEISSLGTLRLNVFPAIDFDRFNSLLRRSAANTEPHRWQTQIWARSLRRAARHWVMTRHMKRLCQPFEIEGAEHLAAASAPTIFIANHTSHIDTSVLLAALPARLRERTAVAAAADRFYREGSRGWWFSLFWNTYPIARGGGAAALDYSLWLLRNGWSVLIFPEGGRFKPGHIQRFRHGPTILAMQAKAPVLPAYLEGLHELMPRGARTPQPGPVKVRFGSQLSLQDVASVPEGTERLRTALLDMAGTREEAEIG